MQRINYSSGAKWEEVVGYSRAVKIRTIVEVAGTDIRLIQELP